MADMTKHELQLFQELFGKYCKQEIGRGHCEPDCCDTCPITDAYNEIFIRFADDEEDFDE